MKNLYLVLLLVFCPLIACAQNVTIPNAAFKGILTSAICADTDDDGVLDSDVDTNNDGEIQVSEALAVTYLNTMGLTFTNMAGINSFSNLRTLYTTGNRLSFLSISGLHNLKSITCSWNTLYSIELSGLDQLETLDCSGNQILTFLNISGSDNLKNLNCFRTRLIHMDVSNLAALETLDCSQSDLATLTVAPSNNILNLNCGKNATFIFDFSAVPNLKTLQCDFNVMTTINVSSLVHLETLNCSNNNLSELDISNLTALKVLDCSKNILTALDLSNSTNLENLSCGENTIAGLDTSNAPNLKTLACFNNQMSSLVINPSTLLESVNCSINHLTALDASNLVNLKDLDCSKNTLATLAVANLAQLKTLNCAYNALPEVNLSGLTSLETLNCGKNFMTALDVSNLNNLQSLTCNNNQIASMNLPGTATLKTLICNFNALTALNITPFVNLEVLACGHNQIAAMDFSNLPHLWSIKVDNNLFTSLDFSQMGGSDQYYLYYMDGNPNLVYVNLKNGAHILHYHSHDPSHFSANACNNLLYICADEFNVSSIYSGTAQINTYCSFSPGGIYNTITGRFTFDQDSNGCDENDYHFANSRINIEDVDGVSGSTFTNVSGNYTFFTQAGSFTIAPAYENPFFTVSPEPAIINFEAVDGTTQTQDFCVTANGIHNDVEIKIIRNVGPRPGFDASYILVYNNKGNQTISGNITLTFDDSVLDFISADPALSSQALNTLNWNYENLLPFESRTINFTVNVNSPQETPPTNIGDILNFSAAINPISGDETIRDNTFDFAQTVLGSYDPNEKTCLEGTAMTPEMVGDYLDYVIHFQNSGTAAAENVVVKDIIDADKFDLSSLRLLASSHPHATRISGNNVEFIFEGINLPASIDDEPGSHGFVAFKIKTKNTLVLDDAVTNTADIYFDYNFPVTTNTATTTVALLLAKDTFEDKSVSVFPNPAKDNLHVTAKQNITSIQLYDVQGRLIETNENKGTDVVFNIGKNASGIYFIKIYTEKGVKVEKIIKE